MSRISQAVLLAFVNIAFIVSVPASATIHQRRVLEVTVRTNNRFGDAYARIGDFMKLEMSFARGDEIENRLYQSVGFTGEKAAGFFTPAAVDPGYGGIFVTVAPNAPRLEDRVQISTEGFDAMMRDFQSSFGRYVVTFNLNEMPASLVPRECARRVGSDYAAACSPSDLDLWRIAVEKGLTHISQTYGVNVQLQLFGEVESRDVWRGFGARNYDSYADNEDFRIEENRLTEDYMRLAVATAEAVRSVNRRTGRSHITTLWTSGVYSERLMRDLNAGRPRNGMETCLAWLEAYNRRTPNSALVWPTIAMGVQLYDWDGTGNLKRALGHLRKLYARYGLPFYVYGYNRSWTSEEPLPPHRNAAFVIGGAIQMMREAFIREGYGYTWTVIGEGDDGRHAMFDPSSNTVNAFGASYQALARLRGRPGTQFVKVELRGGRSDQVQAVASVAPDGASYLLVVNNANAVQDVSIKVDASRARYQQFWHIGPGEDGQDYSTRGLNENESATYERNPAKEFKLQVMPYALLLVKTF